MTFRIGIGFDSHRLEPGGPLRLGGVDVSAKVQAVGHSDGDVLLHALTDALLGAIGAGDIGEHFSPEDPQYRDADSGVFIKHAMALLRQKGFQVVNADSVVTVDRPALKPYKERMAGVIAGFLQVAPERISVKAKTTEGFDPKDLGITAQAAVLVEQRS